MACASSAGPAGGARAAGYGIPEAQPRMEQHEAAAVDALNTALVQRGFQAASVDARLSHAAAALNVVRLGRTTREACDVSPGLEEAALDWAGVHERPVCSRCFWTRKKPGELPQDVVLGLAECVGGPGTAVVGVSTGRDGGRTFVSLVAARHRVTVDPVYRAVPAGAVPRLAGTLRADGAPYSLLVAPPEGVVEARRVEPGAGGRFSVDLPAPTTRGGVVASLVDGSGQEVTRVSWEQRSSSVNGPFDGLRDEAEPTTAGPRATYLRRGLEVLRRQRGLPPATPSALLDAAAQEDANTAASGPGWLERPLAGGQADAVASAAPSVRLIKMTGDSAADVLWQASHSPAILWALTRPVPTDVGVGLAQGSAAGSAQVSVVLLLSSSVEGAFDVVVR